ncbi:uncharacterized protein LTR77_003515 [Saxophila tyrrhenica]|uniref:Ubiquitin 3 binding protein But2 C-terminal domain-containing protein n=1 Tax=Saxophila tyrrhenica TaxID=1690608 RepID=A0AAV9PDU0_9PEZI|nr:hypothetical protein LTR77_003515 [Saxophila tyrrhenica]
MAPSPHTSTVTAPCTSSCVAPPPPPPMPKKCPLDLPESFEFAHLIVRVDSANPDKALGNYLNGTVSPSVSSIFNFDFPENLADKTCHLYFSLPEHDQLETSAYEFGGEGKFKVSYLSGVASKETAYNNAPKVDDVLKEFTLTPGTAVAISEREGCAAGQTVSFEMSAVGDSYLNYFQDFNPYREFSPLPPDLITADLLFPAIGLYVIPS